MTVGGSADKSVNNASIYVKLTDIDQRTVSQQDLMQRTRDLLKKYPHGIHTSVELVSTVGGNQSNADVQYFIQGPDLDKLAQYSDQLLAKMKTIPGLVDADTTLRSGKPEVRLEIDRPRAADLGVSVMDIEQALNTLVAGQVASTFNAGEDQYDVRVRAQEQFRGSAEGLAQDDRALLASVGSVGLDEVVHIEPGTGPSSINRINRQRQVTLTGNVLPGGSQADIHRHNSNQMSARAGHGPRLPLPDSPARPRNWAAPATTSCWRFRSRSSSCTSCSPPSSNRSSTPSRSCSRCRWPCPFGIVSLLIVAPDREHLLRPGPAAAVRHRQEERHSADRPHQRPARRRALPLRRHHPGQPRPPAAHPDDHHRAGRRHGCRWSFRSGTGAATNRSIGVLVVGGQSLCLLLTLLAVPVFYSLFEDLGESFAHGRVARFFGWIATCPPSRKAAARAVSEGRL